MRKLILILALGLVLGACAGETRVVVVTATPVPPTVTASPPTATPLPPTITPEPWDAKVSGFVASLYQLPNSEAPIMKTLAAGLKLDLIAVTEDKEWVQATADLGDWKGTGWLLVDELELNVSLDDLEVDTETVFVPPPTSIPEPTEVLLGERYINHFLERGFEYNPDREQYLKQTGWGELFVAVNDSEDYVFGWIERGPVTPEDTSEVFDHLEEASNFLDPGNGWDTAQGAIVAISEGALMGAVTNDRGRNLFFQTRPLDADGSTWLALFTFPDTFSDPLVPLAATPVSADIVGYWFSCKFGTSDDCQILDDDGMQFTADGHIYDITEPTQASESECGGSPCFRADQLSITVERTFAGAYFFTGTELTVIIDSCAEVFEWQAGTTGTQFRSACLDFDSEFARKYTGTVASN